MTFEKILMGVVKEVIFFEDSKKIARVIDEKLYVKCKRPEAKHILKRLQYELMVCKIKYKIRMIEDYDAMRYTYEFY